MSLRLFVIMLMPTAKRAVCDICTGCKTVGDYSDALYKKCIFILHYAVGLNISLCPDVLSLAHFVF